MDFLSFRKALRLCKRVLKRKETDEEMQEEGKKIEKKIEKKRKEEIDEVAPNLFFTLWTLFSFALSIFALVNAVSLFFVNKGDAVGELVYTIDLGICFVFLCEYIILFSSSKDKKAFLKRRWIDVLAIVPFSEFRIFRLFRVLLIIKVIRHFSNFNEIKKLFPKTHSDIIVTRYLVFFFLLVAMTLIPSTAILILVSESGVEGAKIQTPLDAMWWSIVTITTVGYGDYYPVTIWGRGIAIVLMVVGIGIFSSITVYLSSFITQILRALGLRDDSEDKVLSEIKSLKKELLALNRKLDDAKFSSASGEKTSNPPKKRK